MKLNDKFDKKAFGYDFGKKEAQKLLKKYKPTTYRTLNNVQHMLKKELETKYPLEHPDWKQGYGFGAISALTEYRYKFYEGGKKK
jgi:hypothetical protein